MLKAQEEKLVGKVTTQRLDCQKFIAEHDKRYYIGLTEPFMHGSDAMHK